MGAQQSGIHDERNLCNERCMCKKGVLCNHQGLCNGVADISSRDLRGPHSFDLLQSRPYGGRDWPDSLYSEKERVLLRRSDSTYEMHDECSKPVPLPHPSRQQIVDSHDRRTSRGSYSQHALHCVGGDNNNPQWTHSDQPPDFKSKYGKAATATPKLKGVARKAIFNQPLRDINTNAIEPRWNLNPTDDEVALL
mmetsp:Transcript_5066/g.10129  ORF Transcript_5066/g.10129 Transcript_5066/m.10129 type:complete len:194 (+) Transcript_5066:328-909(+)